jgi:hypothetical protein
MNKKRTNVYIKNYFELHIITSEFIILEIKLGKKLDLY